MPDAVVEVKETSKATEKFDEVYKKEDSIPLVTGFSANDFARRKFGVEVESKKDPVKEPSVKITEEPKKVELTPVQKALQTQDFSERDQEIEETFVPPKKVQPSKVSQRDFTGIDEPDVQLFKQMSEESFNKLKPLYIEHRELKNNIGKQKQVEERYKDLPPNYYSNPKGYQLSPQYETKVKEKDLANAILDHWTQQEIAIRRTNKYQPLIQDASGNISVGEIKDADENAELAISKHLNFARQQASKYNIAYDEFVGSFNSIYEDDLKVIKDTEEKLFKDFNNEKHPTKKMQDEIVKLIPPSFRENNPLLNLLKYAGVHNILLLEELKQLKTQLATANGIKKDTAEAPPTKDNFVATSNQNGKHQFSKADFDKRKLQ